MFGDLTSYFVRRAVCGLTPKNYNKNFLEILRKISAGALTPETLRSALSDLTGTAARWPNDNEFRKAMLTEAIYPGRLDAARMRAVLSEIEVALRSAQSEDPTPTGLNALDIDHIMPQSWWEHWALPDGSKATASEVAGIALDFLINADEDQRRRAILRREELKKTMGNLTLLHYGANRSLQNREFAAKRDKLIDISNLHLNRMVMMQANGTSFVARAAWDEAAIAERGELLIGHAIKIWRSPLS